ncbi:mitochondrial dicarboxylate carrier isoform 1-T1 [Porphyrio hochstetteri]
MCHIPVPAPGRAQDSPHELPGRVPGCSALCHGNCQARPPRLLQGLRSCCHPAHSSHRPHLRLPGTAAQILWDQSDHLSRRDGTLTHPRGVSRRVTAAVPEPLCAVWGQAVPPTPHPHSCALPAPMARQSQASLSPLTPFSVPPLPLGCSWASCPLCTVCGGGSCFLTTLPPASSAVTSLSPVPLGCAVWGGTHTGIWPSGSLPGHQTQGWGACSPCAHAAAGLARSPASPVTQLWCDKAPSSHPASGPVSSAATPSAASRPPTHPASACQNSPAPDGCWALQGSCLIPMMTAQSLWARGSRSPPAQVQAGALCAWARPAAPLPFLALAGARPCLCTDPALTRPRLLHSLTGPFPRPGQTPAPSALRLPHGPPTLHPTLRTGAVGTSPSAVCTPVHGGPEGSKNWNICDLNI